MTSLRQRMSKDMPVRNLARMASWQTLSPSNSCSSTKRPEQQQPYTNVLYFGGRRMRRRPKSLASAEQAPGPRNKREIVVRT